MIPIAAGGSNSEINLVTACRKCNRRKGKKLNFKAVVDIDNTDKELSTELLLSTPEDGRDILTDNKAGHLVFRDGNRVIDIPDTPENKNIYLHIVEQMLNVSGAIGKMNTVTA